MTRQVKTMAVLFADVSDSTGLYHKLGDATARNVINACLTEIIGLLPRFDGRAIKTIGDEVMCVFPSADLAVLAASEMQSLITSGKTGNHPVLIHVGLHHGSVRSRMRHFRRLHAVNVAASDRGCDAEQS